VTFTRTAVERDYKGDVINAHAPEMPTRFAKQLAQMVRGGLALGMSRESAMRLALRCGRDSAPPLRIDILLDLASNPGARGAGCQQAGNQAVSHRPARARGPAHARTASVRRRAIHCGRDQDRLALFPGRRLRPRNPAIHGRALKTCCGWRRRVSHDILHCSPQKQSGSSAVPPVLPHSDALPIRCWPLLERDESRLFRRVPHIGPVDRGREFAAGPVGCQQDTDIREELQADLDERIREYNDCVYIRDAGARASWSYGPTLPRISANDPS
jgi:hypothetical protein